MYKNALNSYGKKAWVEWLHPFFSPFPLSCLLSFLLMNLKHIIIRG